MSGESQEADHRTKGLVRLTMACNERCPFCNVPVEDYATPTPDEARVLAEVDALVASGGRTLTISGGEPTLLRARLLRVVRAARERGVSFVELQTNAVLVDGEYAVALAAAGVTSAFVSLLSDAAALHDELAGLEGAFGRCLAGIDAFVAAGIRVTLNPVTAAATQSRLPGYVDFVAARLPAVRSISVSAVQPHGRAARDPGTLLPDYAVLGPAVREALRRAEAHGIELLNPYCGLPLCVGWEDRLDRSVEAVEAATGTAGAPGVRNEGDKRHGPPCRACVLRARCGGAWHAYWEVRGGSGLTAPARVAGPWAPSSWERVVDTLPPPPSDRPFSWLLTRAFSRPDADAALKTGLAGIAVVLDDAATGDPTALSGIHRVARRRGSLPPQRQPLVWLAVERPTAAGARRAVELAAALGLDAVRFLTDEAAWRPYATALARATGVDVAVEGPPRRA